MTYDVVFKEASLLDGTGSEAFTADVAVEAGRIAGIGSVGKGAAEVDARGLTLSPGFVDTHAHDDGALLRYPGMEFKVAQGVTTDVVGNCGFSVAPATREAMGMIASSAILAVGEVGIGWTDQAGYRDAVNANPPALNAIALAGHNTLRIAAMKGEKREPNAGELEAMKGWLEEAMEAGACGLSTGLFYAPGRWAHTDEVIELAKVIAPYRGVYATHMRDEGVRLLDSVDETLTIGREAGVGVHISHHKAAGEANWGRVKESLKAVDSAVEAGQEVTLDVYPYIAGSTRLEAMSRAINDEVATWIRVASSPTYPQYEGWSIADIAADMKLPAREATEKLIEGEGRETICLQFGMCEEDVETVLAHPLVMVGSDGIPVLEGKPHPRLFGTFPRVLGDYVRERGVLALPEAIRKMTSLPAERFGLKDRGVIREGAWADLVLFDAVTVRDQATFEEPHQEPVGIAAVFVSGVSVYQDGRHTGNRPGRMLTYEPGGTPVGTQHTASSAPRTGE
jgi:N-acyl-D-amino-acid deacylase